MLARISGSKLRGLWYFDVPTNTSPEINTSPIVNHANSDSFDPMITHPSGYENIWDELGRMYLLGTPYYLSSNLGLHLGFEPGEKIRGFTLALRLTFL